MAKHSLPTKIATLGRLGTSRMAPGTIGSFVALWLAPLLFLPLSFPLRILSLTVLFFVGVWASDIARQELGDEDPSCVIIDEVLGQWIALMPLSSISYFGANLMSNTDFFTLLCAFMLFRVFDITKLGPVGLVERKVGGGLGIMLDDIVAGFFAAIFVYPIDLYLKLVFV